jgi:DNA-binding NarL/FixJ family response regulator
MPPIRVFLVEPCRLFGEVLAFALAQREGLSVVGTACSVEAARQQLSAREIDLLLLGAGCASAATVREIRRLDTRVHVVVLGVGDSLDEIVSLMEAGAGGFTPRDAVIEDVTRIVEAVPRGESHCPPRVAARLIARITELAQLTGPSHPDPREKLSGREVEILDMVAAGLANKEIAKRLGLALCTVKNHVHRILDKLKVRRRLEAVRFARPRGAPIATTADWPSSLT